MWPTSARQISRLGAEHRLIGRIVSADWQAGAKRSWPRDWFGDIDWPRIPGLSWQHKARPMMAAALREAGYPGLSVAVRGPLENAERNCVSRNMRQVALLRDLVAAANEQGLRVIALKGVALSARLYGDPFIREAFDLDLLVHPEDVSRMDALLLAMDCRPPSHDKPLSPRQDAHLRRFSHDRKFIQAEYGVVVERHHSLDQNPNLIATDFEGLWNGRAQVRIGDFDATCLGDAALAHYLYIHAARHAWERWKWIGDLVALSRHWTGDDFRMHRDVAQRAGSLHLFQSWLLLTQEIAGADASAEALGAATDRKARRVADRALQMSSVTHTERSIRGFRYNLRLIVQRLLLKNSPRYFGWEILVLLHRDRDWRTWRLPDRLIFLYYLMRPISYISRGIASLVRS